MAGFFKATWSEFKKVIWPSKSTVAKQTIATVFFSIALGLLIALIDTAVKAGLGLIL